MVWRASSCVSRRAVRDRLIVSAVMAIWGLIVGGPAGRREIPVLGQRRHHFLGPDAAGHRAVVAQIEPRAAPQPQIGDALLLPLLRHHALRADAPVLALPVVAQLLALALHPTAPVR